MDDSAFTIINQIKRDLSETNHTIEENQLVIFKTTDKIVRIKYKKGDNIINEGEDFKYVFFISKGFLKVYRDVSDSKVFIRIVAPGEFIGLNLFSRMRKYPYSLVALENSIVYVIHGEAFKDEIYRNPQVMKWVIGNLSFNISDLYRKIVSFRTKHMNGRIADAILHFSEDIFKSNNFQLPITKKQLGHYANVSPENVTRILKIFQNDKILDINGKNINILDKDHLVKISKIG